VKISRRKMVAVVAGAGAATFALIASGCSTGPAEEESGPITLKIATFNNFGYSDELLAEYEDSHPNITIEHNVAATSGDARTNYFTKLGAGSGLADIEAVEIDWFAELLQYSDKLTDLSSPEVEGRWLDWKTAAATDADGRLIAYGTDIGPQAICYRSDLFEAAGLPTDREEVATLLTGDWNTYFDAGKEFTSKSDAAWFDSTGSMIQGMLNQEVETLEAKDGSIIATENAVVKSAYDSALAAAPELSAHLGQWSDDWFAGFGNGAFATMLCPSWMLADIEKNGADVTGWDIADVYPNGGGNWGGSYITVPAQSKHAKAAQELAAWLTAPEQQLKAFIATGNFPSQIAMQDSDELLAVTRPFFNDAPVGQIMANRAAAVPAEAPYKGPKYFAVMEALQNAITRVDVDKTSNPADSWDQFVKDVDALK
jgi:cellobiose transport system substrate-binding protein